MSLSRDAVEEIRKIIRHNCANFFGKKFFECRTIAYVHYCTKGDKYEPRFLVISKFRVFILIGKNPEHLKVERKFNILSLRALQIVSPSNDLNLSWEDRSGRSIARAMIRCEERDTSDLARDFLATLKHYFPDVGRSLMNFVTIVPSQQLLSDFSALPESTPKLLCNNFRRSYVAVCDYYDHRYKDEVIWDIEHIYFTNDLHELRLEDFVHLTVKDQVTILASIQFSNYFTGVSVDGTKLTSDHVEALFNIVRRSHSLQSLKLVNCNLPKDFVSHFASAISANIYIPLETVDFSGNNLEDRKGFQSLSVVLPKLSSLRSLSFANCNMSEKCIALLASGLISGFTTTESSTGKKLDLRNLTLSGNAGIKDDISELVNFVSLCTSLRVIDLTGTGILVDRLWGNLKLGGLQLEVLRLGSCSTGKRSKDHANVVKELFGCMVNLKEIDFSGTPLGPELLMGFLTGLANNSQVREVTLNLNGVVDKVSAGVLEKYLCDCPIGALSMRDCSMETAFLPVLASLRRVRQLTRLDIGGSNVYSLKSNKKYAAVYTHVLDEIVKLMNESNLQELNLSDSRIGDSVHVILNALGISKLVFLDLSNNELGNIGARLLSKALQLNHCLQKLVIDRNQITAEGFHEIASALRLNTTLRSLPTPLIDVSEALSKPDRARVLTAITEIERCLENNQLATKRSEELRQKVLHKLNNRADNYDINSSDYKRIIFFEVIKAISDFGTRSPVCVGIDDVVESIVGTLQRLAIENDDHALNRLRDDLGLRHVDIAQSSAISGDDSDTVAAAAQESHIRKTVTQLVETHLTETAWATVFVKADRLLSSVHGLKLRPSFSAEPIDNSVHSGFLKHTHRPASIIQGSGSPSRTESLTELNGGGQPLVHLNKTRPKPPHMLRKNRTASATGGTATPSDATPPTSHRHLSTLSNGNSGPMNHSTTSNQSSASSSGADSGSSPFHSHHRPALLPPSPSPLHASIVSEGDSQTPPPIPRRIGGPAPPRLPPKPDSPAKSPTTLLKFNAFAAAAVAAASKGNGSYDDDDDDDDNGGGGGDGLVRGGDTGDLISDRF